MHEQAHAAITEKQTPEAVTQPPPGSELKRDELVKQIGDQMKLFAFENPCLSNTELNEGIASGRFSKFLTIGNTRAVHVVLTVSPPGRREKEETGIYCWHCSMSIVSRFSGKPKSIGLWTRTETDGIKKLLAEILGDSGMARTQTFLRTKTALHLSRDLTPEEFSLLFEEGE